MTERQTRLGGATSSRTGSYPSDVSDAEWEFLAPFLTLMTEEAPQRVHPLRDVFNAVRYIVRSGCPWRMLPNDLPPWEAVYQQARRWQQAGVFEQIAHELRLIERTLKDRDEQPTAVVLDGRTLRSTPESGHRASYDGAKRKNGSKVHIAVDTLGNLLAVVISGGKDQERAQVGELTGRLQELTGESARSGVRRSGLHREGGCRCGRRPPCSARSREAHRGQKGVRALAKTMGGRTNLRLARSAPPTRP